MGSGSGMTSGTGMGSGSGGTGLSNYSTGLPPFGATPQNPVHGHHTTVTAEVLDPHIGQSGTGTTGSSGLMGSSGMTGSSGNQTTSGPHKSDLMNKMDPRVDSDRDGSKFS